MTDDLRREQEARDAEHGLKPSREKDEQQSWIGAKLKAILSVNPDGFEPDTELSDVDMEDFTRSGLAGGLTPGGLGSPFDR